MYTLFHLTCPLYSPHIHFSTLLCTDSCSDTECCTVSPSDMVVEADSWEENWLFRRQRLAGVNNFDPITMLIPNPEAHVTATVGNRSVLSALMYEILVLSLFVFFSKL